MLSFSYLLHWFSRLAADDHYTNHLFERKSIAEQLLDEEYDLLWSAAANGVEAAMKVYLLKQQTRRIWY